MCDRFTAKLASRLGIPQSIITPGQHLGIRWRNLEPQDTDRIFSLSLASEETQGSILFIPTQEDFTVLAQDQLSDPGRSQAIVGVDEKGNIQAWASVKLLEEPTKVLTALINGAVHPNWSGRGLGRSMLHWQDQMARVLIYHSGWEGTVHIGNYVCPIAHGRSRLFTAGGYTPLRKFQIMLKNLEMATDVPSLESINRNIPEGFTLASWNDEVADSVHSCHIEAFSEHWGQQTISKTDLARFLTALEPNWSPVIIDSDKKVAAYIYTQKIDNSLLPFYLQTEYSNLGASKVDIQNIQSNDQAKKSQLYTVGYSEFLGVLPKYRNIGISKVCLQAAANAAKAAGANYLGLDVDISDNYDLHNYYLRCGYEDTMLVENFYGIEI